MKLDDFVEAEKEEEAARNNVTPLKKEKDGKNVKGVIS